MIDKNSLHSEKLKNLLHSAEGSVISYNNDKTLEKRLTGRFYTPKLLADCLIQDLLSVSPQGNIKISIIDPFCGDGRLAIWLIENLVAERTCSKIDVSVWDIDSNAVEKARQGLEALGSKLCIDLNIDAWSGDSFQRASQTEETFDLLITNPPWETLKPDTRELGDLSESAREEFDRLLREKSNWLEKIYPYSRPSKKFSGWGVNLARCGIECSIRLTKKNGRFGIVAPATIFGDQISSKLRQWLYSTCTLDPIHHFPAETRAFPTVDQACLTFSGTKGANSTSGGQVVYGYKLQDQILTKELIRWPQKILEENLFAIGFSASTKTLNILEKISNFDSLGTFEENDLLWIGRELDETGMAKRLLSEGEVKFVKGRDLFKYDLRSHSGWLALGKGGMPWSAKINRIAWRDVARLSSKKRMQAAKVPAGIVSGNSLNILVVSTGDQVLLNALLGILNSSVFELQVKSLISTNHLSSGAVRRLKVPNLNDPYVVKSISDAVTIFEDSSSEANEERIDFAVATAYGLDLKEVKSTALIGEI